MIRSLTGILLLLVIIAPAFITHSWLHYRRLVIKQEVKEALIQEMYRAELILLKFSKEAAQTTLRWKDEVEFEYQGQMYDVAETQTKGDSLYFWCWRDHKETELNRQLENLATKSVKWDPLNREHQERLFVYYKSLYSFEFPHFNLLLDPLKNKGYADYLIVVSSHSLSPPTPPPKCS